MYTISTIINFILPVLGVILFVLGVVWESLVYVILSLWLSLIALLLQYQLAGGEILGSYFNSLNAAIYTLNLLILVVSLIWIAIKAPSLQGKIRYLSAIISALAITGAIILIINLWVNAHFLGGRIPNSPIMQVVSFRTPPAYCSYQYLFYRIGQNGKIGYLCPAHYGLLPSTGELEVAPDFLVHQLSQHVRQNI